MNLEINSIISLLIWKSFCSSWAASTVRSIKSAMMSICSSVSPMVVMAGVPSRIPLGLFGGAGSNGMAFMLVSILTLMSAFDRVFPSMFFGRRSTRIR